MQDASFVGPTIDDPLAAADNGIGGSYAGELGSPPQIALAPSRDAVYDPPPTALSSVSPL
jgi:hypothetical protein